MNLYFFERLLAGSITSEMFRGGVSCLISLVFSVICVTILSLIFKRISQKQDSRSLKEADH